MINVQKKHQISQGKYYKIVVVIQVISLQKIRCLLFGFVKHYRNWKAIVSGTEIKELIEVTYNGDKNEVYVDVYDKKLNVAITLQEG